MRYKIHPTLFLSEVVETHLCIRMHKKTKIYFATRSHGLWFPAQHMLFSAITTSRTLIWLQYVKMRQEHVNGFPLDL